MILIIKFFTLQKNCILRYGCSQSISFELSAFCSLKALTEIEGSRFRPIAVPPAALQLSATAVSCGRI